MSKALVKTQEGSTPAKTKRRKSAPAKKTRRRRHRKHTGLSAGFTGVKMLIVNAAKVAGGAVVARVIHNSLPSSIPNIGKTGIKLAAAYFTGKVAGQPTVAYGMVSETILDNLKNLNIPLLSDQEGFPIGDNANYVPANLLAAGYQLRAYGQTPDGTRIPLYYNERTNQWARP